MVNHYIQSDIYYRIRMQLVKEGLDLVPVFDEGKYGEFFPSKRVSAIDGLMP